MTRIADNRKARHDYFIEEEFEAGMVLEGWEVKAIRAGRTQIGESHIVIRNGELFVLNMLISPLGTASTHIRPDASRTRKLLMHKHEINKLIGRVEQRGFTLVPLNLYYKNGLIKMTVGLAKGKKQHDKRATIKERDWEREKARIMKNDTR
ncbi:SsrA-binding protein [Oligella urethralis]|uniref:SsrA-binding protein n=1 Tax=Oligella urethralis TaxID=90245 RepID=A0A2N6QEE5_9BURK|nr:MULTISPECIES: SsrA-binding protein SmpB [Oligella]AVL70981.1 SsrA-binding protein SmpB [Oligella urethralis]MDK6202032.1 SsrA-binding protein SmpB [Oligella urethralis]OFS84633.1 SsrA-binding protein [Oligella sp. HMSC05A10]PMC17839.1 SsrA-binding protein SmpB [Oligella urethralis]WOS37496.1 SsrA-binding protein [Oligella urethralis]